MKIKEQNCGFDGTKQGRWVAQKGDKYEIKKY